MLGSLVYFCLRRRNQTPPPPPARSGGCNETCLPSYGYYPVYPPVFHPTQPPIKRRSSCCGTAQAADVASAHRSWGSVSQSGGIPGYSYAPTSASLLSSTSQTSPIQSPAHSPQPQSPHLQPMAPSNSPAGYFPHPQQVFVQQPIYVQPQPQPQVYYYCHVGRLMRGTVSQRPKYTLSHLRSSSSLTGQL